MKSRAQRKKARLVPREAAAKTITPELAEIEALYARLYRKEAKYIRAVVKHRNRDIPEPRFVTDALVLDLASFIVAHRAPASIGQIAEFWTHPGLRREALCTLIEIAERNEAFTDEFEASGESYIDEIIYRDLQAEICNMPAAGDGFALARWIDKEYPV